MDASIVLIVSACIFLAIGVPVAFALGLSTVTTLILAENYPLMVLLKETFTGIDSFPLMAVPFFILAAELMSGGSLTEVLLRFAGQFVGHRRGGLGYTNVVSLTFFSGISGSALADAAGPGSMLIKMMDKAGYDRSYAAALTASTAIVGPIIPPSIIMIIYALQDETVSVGTLFAAGILPGILIAVAMCVVNFYVSKKRNYKGDGQTPPLREILITTWKAIPAILLPVVILGGMRAGWFTPTEASVVAVFYALVCGKFIYRTLEWKMLPDILSRSALLSASVLIIIGLSASFAWVLTIEGIPQQMAEWLISMNLSPWMFLIIVNVFLLLFGIFIEPLPGVMVLAPILAPVAIKLGVDPVHFAMIVIFNLTLGMITPPVGGLLFVTCNVSKVPMSALVKELVPFLWAHGAVLMILTFVPALSTWLPRALGFK
ncbi:tripartite ATP-independent transporter DctM subunit [Variovorax boronicumulans]|jgi:C4-dicarboxylate transporter DctM subunit|uniref:TRAP transporter large permease protein n=2 Tax=Variovorax TaxID=34072 RepID=A0AAW8CVJ4_9BURK|nr:MULTISPECIES: TRAP transporter large permease [Variovorax]ADU36538.1 TRAP dicarboxylate transporter, DctM subunit [Variovorax paradoxus EPS]MDP9894459.1 tripartite ATP-independent transporter DctM subunit [Variovorax boronicumulans]MDP9992823.1 tripartite ATP-independent transporter DctM subunit [Variovorax boronicumulans]MDQ0004086.1 tripartite ATP-independent transporter DctM subunit [Variovorax boronicumulans]MDQ0039657.1 tripartite ATP-independent transporter DctM subunit [Variovorax bo